MLDRISLDPQICHGTACIKGTRLPVRQVVGMLTNGETFESLLKAYPNITKEDIQACREYAIFETEVKECFAELEDLP